MTINEFLTCKLKNTSINYQAIFVGCISVINLDVKYV